MKPFDISQFENRVSKAQLAEILGICPRSAYSYHKFCLDNIDEYDSDFFSYNLGNGKKHIASQLPLTPYQCWCIYGVASWIKQGLTTKILAELLGTAEYQEKISKQAFNEFLKEIPEHGRQQDNTYQGLCKAA